MKTTIVAAVCAGACLAGCDTMGLRRAVSEDNAAKMHRVAVVSVIGDDVHLTTRGFTVFGNKASVATVPEWKLDDHVEQRALSDLKRAPAFASALLDRAGHTALELRIDGDRLAMDLAQRQGFDTLVIVHPGVSENYAGVPPGVGVYSLGMLGLPPHTTPVAAFVVSVVNVAQQHETAWQWGGDSPFLPGKRVEVPMHDEWSSYNADEQAQVHDLIVQKLDTGVDEALLDLHLSPTAAGR